MTTLSSNRRPSNSRMQFPTPIRHALGAALCCCLVPLCVGQGQVREANQPSASDSDPGVASEVSKPVVGTDAPQEKKPDKKQLREADEAYLSGAKKLDLDDLDAAEREFNRALRLDPTNRRYAIAISVVHQHRVTELVQQSTQARLAGDAQKGQALLEQARALDPQNPMVLEHSQLISVAGATQPSDATVADPPPQPWHIDTSKIDGPILLQPTTDRKSFDNRGLSNNVLQDVARQYGIRAVLDPSVQNKNIHFLLENVTYDRAMSALTTMTHTFAVPLDKGTVFIALDNPENRRRLDRQLQETIEVPGATTQKLQDIANIIRTIFNLKDAVVDASAARIVVRGPQSVFGPLNSTLEPLMDTGGEVLLEVRLYERDKSSTTKVGTQLPTEFTAFNVDQAARQIVNDNQSLVQQAIAQGYVSATATNLQIALALIGAGLVKSNLATNLIGVFGGGILQTGVSSATTGLTLNLSRNWSETRTLDDVQLRVNEREEATFRSGTRYPITTSTYTTGLPSAPSALSNASINGVNVASLLPQLTGGTSATIPQISYEDLGLTLKAKPVFQSGDRISMQLDLTIQALSGSGLNDIPVLLNRHFVTSLSVADGESALIVSDVSKTESAAISGIPGLSELPGLHPPTEKDTIRDSGQLVVVVTPHIVKKRLNNVAGPRMALTLPPAQ